MIGSALQPIPTWHQMLLELEKSPGLIAVEFALWVHLGSPLQGSSMSMTRLIKEWFCVD